MLFYCSAISLSLHLVVLLGTEAAVIITEEVTTAQLALVTAQILIAAVKEVLAVVSVAYSM